MFFLPMKIIMKFHFYSKFDLILINNDILEIFVISAFWFVCFYFAGGGVIMTSSCISLGCNISSVKLYTKNIYKY